MGKGREKGDHSSAKVTSERHSRSTPGGAPRCLSRVAPPHPCPSPFLSHHSAWDPALQRPLLDNLLAPTLVSRPYLRREQVLHASEDTLIPSEVDPKLDAPDSLLTVFSRLFWRHLCHLHGSLQIAISALPTLIHFTGPTW